MTITKLFSKGGNKEIFKSALKSKIPFMITTAILMVLIIAVPYFMEVRYYSDPSVAFSSTGETTYEVMQRRLRGFFSEGVIIEEFLQIFCTLLLGVMAYAVALNANSYMHSKSRTDLYHSLPVTRPQMLLSNMAASMFAIVVPYTVIHFGIMIAQQVQFGMYNCFSPDYYAYTYIDYFTNLLFVFVIYSFTTLICTQVGTVFDSLAITGVVGFIPMFLYLFCGMMWDSYTYGADFYGDKGLMLSPFLFVFQRYVARYSWDESLLVPMLAWLALGVGILYAAIFLYKKRKSEKAGQTQSQGLLQTITKMFVSFCGAIVFFGIFYSASTATRIVGMIVGGACIGIIAELILSRGVKHLLRNLKWLALGSALACIIQVMIVYDVIGYETRIPHPDKVASVSINYKGSYENMPSLSYSSRINYQGGEEAYQQKWGKGYTGQEIISQVVAVHRMAVEHRPPKDFFDGYSYYDVYKDYMNEYITITYHMKNGSQMTRYYNRMHYEAVSMLAQLEDKEQFIQSNHPIFWAQKEEGYNDHLITHISINHSMGAGALQRLALDAAQKAEFMDALRQDILAEPLDEMLYPKSPTVATVYVRYTIRGSDGTTTDTFPVHVKSSYTNTMDLLEQIGAAAYLESKEVLPDGIYVIPMNLSPISTHSSNYRLVRSKGISADSYSIQYTEDTLPDYDDWLVENPVRVRALMSAARSALFVDPYSYYSTVCLIAVKNGRICGYSYAYTNDLPEFIREDVMEYQHAHREAQLEENDAWEDEYYYRYYF